MTQAEAFEIVDMLKNGCVWHRFDEPGVCEAYIRSLIKYNYRQMVAAVDIAIENDSKNVPPISTLVKICRENKPILEQVTNIERCYICNNTGIVMMKQKNDVLKLEYDYVLHCICPVGMAQTYDGQNCKEKSTYRVPSVSEYFDDYALNEIKKANKRLSKPMTESEIRELKERFSKFGLRIPDLKPFEEDHGDAWEGDGMCPF